MRLTKAQLKHLTQELTDRAAERLEDLEGEFTEEQWESIILDLAPDIENALDHTWPDHIPSREES